MKPHKKPKHASQSGSDDHNWRASDGIYCEISAEAEFSGDDRTEKMCPYSLLTVRPNEYKHLSLLHFSQTIADLARPHVMLSGVSYDGAEISDYAIGGYGDDRPGNAISFCLGDTTYTCFEDPNDGYRSSLGLVLARAGNRLKNNFEAVGLLPFACACGASDDECYFMPLAQCLGLGKAPPIVAFGAPNCITLQDCALAIGTSNYDDWYPSCVMRFSAENLTKAKVYELSFVDELRNDLPLSSQSGARRSKFF